jgi:hypothetical protein
MTNYSKRQHVTGYIVGVVIGGTVAYGTMSLIKLGYDWTKAVCQELKERKELKSNQ